MDSKSILIVDDDPDTQILLKKRLSSAGFECLCVSSVTAAIQALRKKRPSLILLDLMFRKTDGTALLHFVRKQFPAEEEKIPILIVSGCGDPDVVDYVLEIGAAGFIQKPIDSKHLMEMVQTHAG